MSGESVLGWASLAVAVISIVNAATRHYSQIEGGEWPAKLLRTLMWVIERVSILPSKGSAKGAKVPGTDAGPGEAGSAGVFVMFALFALALVVALLSSGCASAIANIRTTQAVAEASTTVVEYLCEPVDALCKSRGESPCAALDSCNKARVVALKSLQSLNEALDLAAMAYASGKSGEAEDWLELAQQAMLRAQQQVKLWRAPVVQ